MQCVKCDSFCALQSVSHEFYLYTHIHTSAINKLHRMNVLTKFSLLISWESEILFLFLESAWLLSSKLSSSIGFSYQSISILYNDKRVYNYDI